MCWRSSRLRDSVNISRKPAVLWARELTRLHSVLVLYADTIFQRQSRGVSPALAPLQWRSWVQYGDRSAECCRHQSQQRVLARSSKVEDERERGCEQQCSDLHCRKYSRNRLLNGRIIERNQNCEDEERETSPVGWVPCSLIPTEQERGSAGHVPRELNEDLSCNPSRPTIHLAQPFRDHVDHPVRDEWYLKLLSTRNDKLEVRDVGTVSRQEESLNSESLNELTDQHDVRLIHYTCA